jgi:hypothetical protein
MTRVPAVIVMVIAVAIAACGGDDGGVRPELDDDPNLPGIFVPAQGRGHLPYTFSAGRDPKPFCPGVISADNASGEAAVDVPTPEPSEQNACYASNPPSSGWHLGVQRNVEVSPGIAINIPPDPDVYPADVEIPREAIPHILEHAGVFVGYNCAGGDAACDDVVREIEAIVNDRIGNDDDRVVMAHDSDLPAGTIGLAAWTRVDTFAYGDFTPDRVERFIDVHSCRFDPEGFCG